MDHLGGFVLFCFLVIVSWENSFYFWKWRRGQKRGHFVYTMGWGPDQVFLSSTAPRNPSPSIRRKWKSTSQFWSSLGLSTILWKADIFVSKLPLYLRAVCFLCVAVELISDDGERD